MEPTGIHFPKEYEPNRAHVSGLDAVNALVDASMEEFSHKSVADIATAFTDLQSEVASIPSDKIKLVRRKIHIIHDRLTRSENIEQVDKEQLCSQIKAILSLLKKGKGLELPGIGLPESIADRVSNPLVASIGNLWHKKDITLSKEGQLQFSDAIAEYVDNDFLHTVFTQSGDVDFSKVEFFNFSRYPKLNAQTPKRIFKCCPQVFNNRSGKTYVFLKLPQFCDHTLIVNGEAIAINRWYMQTHSRFLKSLWEDTGQRTALTDFGDTLDIDAKTLQEGLDCLYDRKKADAVDRPHLVDVLKVATLLDIPALVQNVDSTLLSIINKKYEVYIFEILGKPVHSFREGLVDEKAISFISEIKKEFTQYLNHEELPRTRKHLNYIAEEVFDKVYMKKRDIKSTNEDLITLFSIFTTAYEQLGPMNLLSDFSLIEKYPLLPWTFVGSYPDIPRTDAILEQYQKLLETCIQYNPRDKKALAVLGLCHQWGHDPDKYVKAKKALEALQASGSLDPKLRCALAELLFWGGKGIMKEPERAIELLESAIYNKPTDPLVYVTLAHLLRESGKSEKAFLLLSQFDDKTKDYTQLLSENLVLIRLYSRYQRVLGGVGGEKLSQDELDAFFSTYQPYSFVGLAREIIVQTYQTTPTQEASENEGDVIFAGFQQNLFDPTFPLYKDVVNHLPEQIKNHLLFDPRIKRLLS